MLPSTFEDYLEAILTITENGRQQATSQEIAAALGTGRAAAGETIASLVEEGYLEQAPGDAVRLTGKGRTVASKVARKHRVLQCFLTEALGIEEDAANREACTLEHGISDETIDRLSSYMDGAQPPPGRLGRCWGRDACTLLDCKEGDTVRVAMLRGPRRNRRLLDLGIFPGEVVQIRRKLPNQSVVVRVKGCDIAISPEIAASIIVESCP
ncbi:DtxR family transcriptional regulator, Mn-dependent transcriptional regulator [Methanoculleus bourgensis MS2]|uniref:DtxR family transcriptional regulator, Mn-dependent transcriptional regulator n=1 Tax=Methanoculleus bourgensis (strain ATCC 43281 / DSM 3045 / OCM 15 / MS2) TaxID=1201294 RepID=I7LJ11_METBM|nr:metal-dependent transcriptional regulator [Methanoculleus bourgensis]CCJ35527.1 DtxR family transcriptional regulator, Mn-dependent transcriptional regulator [Methanoculleus bourgensis MS2]